MYVKHLIIQSHKTYHFLQSNDVAKDLVIKTLHFVIMSESINHFEYFWQFTSWEHSQI